MTKIAKTQKKIKKNKAKRNVRKKTTIKNSKNPTMAEDDVVLEETVENVEPEQPTDCLPAATKSTLNDNRNKKKIKNIKNSKNRTKAVEDDVSEESVENVEPEQQTDCLPAATESTLNDNRNKKKNKIKNIKNSKNPTKAVEDDVPEESVEMVEPEQQIGSLSAETESTSNDNHIKKKKKIKGKSEQRSEASQNISEFNLTEVGKEKIKLDELIKTSQKLSGQVLVKKQLQSAKKLKSLSIPLSKPQLQKIKRTLAYENACTEVSKWDTIVKSNRDAEQVIYPLKRPEFHLESFDTVAERFVSKHPVEEAVSEILKTSENVLDQTRTLTVAEEKALQAMSLEEAKLRHNELMRHRTLMSYQEAKARRQNKIKSKRYHRILKREKLKQMMKEFEELQKTDQKAALEKFLETDKLRILERMTLKHRNTGKWAKMQKIRAKYNPESRSNLKEDLLIGRQLRQKVDSNLPPQQERFTKIDPEDKFFEDSTEDYLLESLPSGKSILEEAVLDNIKHDSNVPTQKEMSEGSSFREKLPKVTETANVTESTHSKLSKKATLEDEMAFSSEVMCLDSMIPDDITFGDEDLDDQEEGKVTIDQAFADEDLIAEFQEEKKAASRANKPEGINLFLPGWGTWGGPGIKASKKRRRRFFIKPLEPQPKKNTLGNVIINEEKDKKASEHQVSHLPFPFSNIHQFESYIRQPIGNTWNPQSSFQNLIAPKVITKSGKIIDPIDHEDVVFEKKTQSVKRPKKKKKNASEEIKAF